MAAENVIPKAVAAEAAEVERVFAEAQKAAQSAAPEPEKTEPEKPAETAVAEPAAEPAAPAEAAQVAEPQPTEAQAVADLQAQLERLRHSHDVLKGKYSKEIPRLHAEARAEREGRQRAEAERDEAKKTQSTQPTDAANPYGLTAEELELGPEVSAVAEKIAKRLTAQAVAEFDKKTPQPRAEPQGDPFWEDLLIEEPDAIEINADPAFVGWLKGTVHGITRQELILDAQTKGDAKRAAAMMTDWKASGQSAAQQPTGTAPKPNQATRPTLAAQVAPNTVTANPGPAQKKTYTMAEYERVMTEIAKGRYLPQRADELQKEFDQAFREGRMR